MDAQEQIVLRDSAKPALTSLAPNFSQVRSELWMREAPSTSGES